MTVKPYSTDRTKKEEVHEMFDRIAPKYDLLNHTLSASIDRWWRRRAVDCVKSCAPRRILDVATGTGDLAIAMARRIAGAQILGVDLSERMLDVARRKVAEKGLRARVALEVGDAERLALPDASFDVATVAFGVRNFGDLEGGLREIARTIRPGGRIVILEFSTPDNAPARCFYGFYNRRILPCIGGLVSHERAAYDYLPESIEAFPAPEIFLGMLARAGFHDCRARSLSFGIAQIYTGER